MEIGRPAPVWLITNGAAASDAQARGVAMALGAPFALHHVSPRAPWRWLAPWGPVAPGEVGEGGRFAPPWPRLLVTVSRQAAPYAGAIRRASDGATFTAALQHPRSGSGVFDFIWTPAHDRVRDPQIFQTLTSPHLLTREALAEAGAAARADIENLPAPRVLLLIGGPNGTYRFGRAELERLLELASRAIGAGTALVSTSRRTPADLLPTIRDWAVERAARLYEGEGPNPFLGWMALADHIIVTADSVNMTGEATFTGKPVHVFHPPGGEGSKFVRFHAGLEAAGATRPFEGRLDSWTYTPLDATAEVAAALRARMAERGVELG